MDEFEELKPQSKVVEIERWNIEDLETYIKRLNDEISKVNQILKKVLLFIMVLYAGSLMQHLN